jgi:SpoVK/Ycf46/Vps4 family AAA+-type ATPase
MVWTDEVRLPALTYSLLMITLLSFPYYTFTVSFLLYRTGQVIVLGATNRPDAVDPALRRPGRFDREFYFPLPNKEARKKIIGINTRNWEPKLDDGLLDMLGGQTKGYGGADLRVCYRPYC